MGKRREAEVWAKLVDEAGEDLIARAASISVEQAEKELAAAGVDVAAERARAEQFLADLASGAFEKRVAAERRAEAPAKVETAAKAEATAKAETPAKTETSGLRERAEPPAPPKLAERRESRKPRSMAPWLAAAAAFVVGVGGTYELVGGGPAGVASPRPPEPPPADIATATELRKQATTACDARRWAECLAALDEARGLDPGGDGDAPVTAARQRAIRAIRGSGNPAP